MINITQKQKEVLSKRIDDFDRLLDSDSVNDLLMAIDDVIIYNLDENDEPDELGIELQKIYDQIYDQN